MQPALTGLWDNMHAFTKSVSAEWSEVQKMKLVELKCCSSILAQGFTRSLEWSGIPVSPPNLPIRTVVRGLSWCVLAYKISKSTRFHMDFWISKRISGFQSGILDLKVDFYISKLILNFVRKTIMQILLMNSDVFSAQMHTECHRHFTVYRYAARTCISLY